MAAVDDSIPSRRTLKYIARLFTGAKEFSCTLFHVQRPIPQFILDELNNDIQATAALKRYQRENEIKAQILLRENRDQLISMGFSECAIKTVTQPRKFGFARDIIDYAQENFFDAIVVSRHRLQKGSIGNVSAKLLEHSSTVTVWVVGGDVTSSKFLVAVDGSENSVKAIGFLCFILEENPEMEFTLYHVAQNDMAGYGHFGSESDADLEVVFQRSQKRLLDRFSIDALQRFKDAGIPESRFEIVTVTSQQSAKAARMILEEVKKGDYGTVVIGRRGIGRAHFFGSISRHVAEAITDRALWVVS